MMIGLIGMPGSGKGECARAAREQGLNVVNMGDLVREHVEKMDLDMTDENIGGVAHSEREKFGYGIWAERTVNRIKELDMQTSEHLIIDGIRGDAEVTVFRDVFGENFYTFAIQMPQDRRFELLQKRCRSDAPITRAEFDIRETRETKWGIEEAIDQADYIISNTGTLQELKKSFNELLWSVPLKVDK